MKNKDGQRYIVRNCFFEPNAAQSDCVGTCLKDIKAAFSFYNPAIIGNHRTGFIGQHSSQNRDNGLKKLKDLLQAIVKKWPDVEFVSSPQLVRIMDGKGRQKMSEE